MRLATIVPGEAVPQGSMRSFASKRKDGTPTGKVSTIAGNQGRLERWRGDVRDSMRRVMEEAGCQPTGDPVDVAIFASFARPKSHLRADGQTLALRAPLVPKPDVDKIARGVLDALTGTVYLDDAQVAAVSATKMYAEPGEPARAFIVVKWGESGE